ncbi:MAG TPA: response regulator transcription factor [Sulfurimonas sp.]|nr:response regulator transcription factor [Sulfurimonas sp.]
MAKIMMIEDDLEFAEFLGEYLEKYNISITNFDDPFLGLSAGISDYDLVILDLSLPGMDGLEVCKKIVEHHDTPIIISSARSDITDKVTALQLGADDYLPKPYDPQEMYARIISLLRRYKKINSEEDDKALFELDKTKELISYNKNYLDLTPAEFDVMSELIHHLGSTVSREQILNASMSLADTSSKSLDVIINRLRHKIDDKEKRHIRSVRGIGYKLLP